MWLPRKKSGSEVDIVPSKESLINDKAVSRGPLSKNVEEERKKSPEKTLESNSDCLEDNIFCALLKNFASFTIFQKEVIKKVSTGFVDCDQESKVTLVISDSGTKSSSEINGSNQELEKNAKKSDDSDIVSKGLKKKQKPSRSSRQSRLSSDKSERVIKVINTTEVEEIQPEDPFVINYDDIYEVTGENSQLLKYLKSSNTVKFDFLNGNTFEGEMCFKTKDGLGFYSWADGSKYKGKFVGNATSGSGYMEWSDESRYDGFFKEGLKDGIGTIVQSLDGSINCTYSGTWVRGFKAGQGTYKLSETDWYDGDFENGLYNGNGIRQYSSGGKYHGQWRDGKQNGRGIMLFSNNDMYIGEWVDGKMEGNGKYVWMTFLNTEFVFPMHNTYIGQWKDGTRHGVGSLILSTGAILSTLWDNNKKHGRGRVLCVNGTVIEANPLFVNDNLVSMKTSTYKSEVIAQEIEKDLEERQKEVIEIMSDLNPESTSSCTFTPYKACSTPINIPPYFMNVDIHLNKFFQLDDWYKRITCIDWCQWLLDMPPGCIPAPVPLSDSNDHLNQTEMTCSTNMKDQSTKTIGGQASVYYGTTSFKEKMKECYYKKGSKFLHRSDTARSPADLQLEGGKCITYIKRRKRPPGGKSIPTGLNTSLYKLLQKSSLKSSSNFGTNLQEYIEQIYLFEKKWLRNRIIKHMSSLQLIYNKYATLCCREKPQFEPGMLRILLWKLLKDLSFEKTGYSIIEIDQMAVGTSDPFDYISVSEMIHYLLILSWELYTKNNIVNEVIPGIIAGGFDLFIIEKVIPLGNQEEMYKPLFARCDTIPLVTLYRLYKSLGDNITVKKFILHLTRFVGRDYEKHMIILLPQPNKFFKYTLKGQNIILPGGEILYKASTFPDFEYIIASYREMPENLDHINLDFFGILGAQTLIDIIVKVCPQISNSSGEIINQNYEISFLEFMDILIQFIDTYLEYKMRYTFDNYDENKIKIINKCLDKINHEWERKISSQKAKKEYL